MNQKIHGVERLETLNMPAPRKYPAAVVTEVRNDLKTMAETPGPSVDHSRLTARQVVERLRKDIEKALDRGHPFEAISETIKSHGVELSPATLRKYWRQAAAEADANKARVRGRGRRSRKAPIDGTQGNYGDDEPAVPEMPERV